MAFQHLRWLHLKRWVQHHKRIVIGVAVAIVLLGGGGAFAYTKLHHKPVPAPKPVVHKVVPKPVVTPPQPTSALTGLTVSAEQAARPVTAIMIENSPDSRPQSGILHAGVVFEAIAEGGITRFLTLWQEASPQLVGPVRSLRQYYLDWLTPFDASVAHVGGSAKSLEQVRGGGYVDLDQFFNPGSYWRATDRYAPHNVYTSFAKLDALNQAKGHTHSTFTGFVRKKETPSAAPNATKIQVHISGPLYDSAYNYDRASNSYLRFNGGTPAMDREFGQLNPKTVIVMKVQESTVLEDGYRQSINTIGDGEVWVFQDGSIDHGRWHKADQKAQLTFTNDAGQVMALNPGQTWITAIPVNESVSWQA
jgi:hypothetical protein